MMNKENSPINKSTFNKRFDGAITFLKNQKIQETRLFDLPWHFILSTENADKSKLLQHANLDFILKKKDDGNTLGYCEWWSTKETIMVDINSQYCSPNITKAQQKTWQDFLTITQQEKSQAIDALWLVIDLPTLLLSQGENKKTFVTMLKSRIRDLQKKINSGFPVYIIITKLDALKGFVDFFDDLSQKDRKQPFGISFSKKQTASSQALAEHFETEFNLILKNLNQRVITRLHHERNLTRKVNIKEFPLQMESIKKPLAAFMQNLADAITKDHNPSLRGLYFTSVEPSSPTEDRLLQPLSHTFELKPYIENQHFPAQADYFVKALLPQVILPDAVNFKYYHKPAKNKLSKTMLRYLTLGGAIAVTLSFTGLFMYRYLSDNNTIQQTEDALAQYQLLHHMDQHFNLKDSVLALNKLATAAQNLNNASQHKLNSHLVEENHAAKIAYDKSLEQLINQQLIAIIQQQLHSKSVDASILYGALKSYLMLAETTNYNADYLVQWLNNYWKIHSELSTNLLTMLQQHLNYFANLSPNAINPDTNLIIQARQKLSQVSTAELINIILENNNNQNPLKVQLTDQQDKYPLFKANKSSMNIPGIYTNKAFEHVYDEVLPATAKQLQQGDWVTGRQGFGVNVDNDMLMKIRQQYISDYITTWEQVINSLQLAPIRSYDQDIYVMNSLITPSASIKRIMKIIYTNTNVSYHKVGTPISKHFAYLDKIIYLFKQNQSAHLKTVIGFLEQIQQSDNAPIAAFELAKGQSLLAAKDNPFTQMQLIAQHAPQPIQNWVNSLLKDTWQLILNDTAITINAAWQNNIYQPFKKNLATQYPFNAKANTDADENTVNQLFSQHGELNKFYRRFIKSFVNDDNGKLTPKTFYAANLPLSTAGLNNLSQLQQVSETLYTHNKPDKLSYHFTLAPEKITGNAKSVDIDLDEQASTYSTHYLSPTQFDWPGNSPQHFASIIFVNDDGAQESVTKTGIWAVLKLLSPIETKIIQKNDKTIETHITLGDYSLDYALTSLNGLNIFLPGNLLGLQAMPSLLGSHSAS